MGLPHTLLENAVLPLLTLVEFYKSIVTLQIVGKYMTPSCMATSLFWWSHSHAETKQGNSRINELEVKMVVSLCLWMLVHGSLDHQAVCSDDIVVLTPYRAQVRQNW